MLQFPFLCFRSREPDPNWSLELCNLFDPDEPNELGFKPVWFPSSSCSCLKHKTTGPISCNNIFIHHDDPKPEEIVENSEEEHRIKTRLTPEPLCDAMPTTNELITKIQKLNRKYDPH